MLACGWKTAGFFVLFCRAFAYLGAQLIFVKSCLKSYFPQLKTVAIADIGRRGSGITCIEKPRFFNPGRLNL